MEALGGIDVNEAAKAHIFVLAMIDAGVATVVLAGLHIDRALVGHEVGLFIYASRKVLFDVLRGDIRNVLGTNLTVAFNKRHHGVLLRFRLAIVNILLLAANIGFVALDNLVLAADRAACLWIKAHGFPDAHGKKPCALVRDAQHSVELVRGDALLRSGHKMEAENPLRQRDLRALHDGAQRDRERLLAIVAMDEARAMALAFHAGYALGLAARANWAFWPAHAFEMGAGRVLVVENRVRQID